MAPPRRSPYGRVVVMGLSWEGHNHYLHSGPVQNADQELNMVLRAFGNYGYRVERMHIPASSQLRSQFPHVLQRALVQLTSPSVSTLIVLYYQGHGDVDRHGHLSLSNGNGGHMHWSEIVNAVINVRSDVLTILNCCHAGAALRSVVSRPNYENHVKEVMMAVPMGYKTTWGNAYGFAACLEQVLRDRRNNWDSNFNGNPYHWAEAINRTMREKGHRSGQVAVRELIRPPPGRAGQPIILSPRSHC
ncbi:hypothetical protein GGR54DRAFT_591378 [Hypoxylon sp. NC1633]|nr:hypothetical protein GGR54DRAFT_591378 [Hypoxylon sp. NC1633]